MTAPDRDPVVAALVKSLPFAGRMCDCGMLPDKANCPTKMLQDALPLARAQAAREQGLVDALTRISGRDFCDCRSVTASRSRHLEHCSEQIAAVALTEYRRVLEAK